MYSVYYKLEGEGINIPSIKFANPYKHLTIYNFSPSDIEVRKDKEVVAFIPENASLTLYDVFKSKNSKFEFADTVLYFHTVPYPFGTVQIHLINFGAQNND